MDLKYAVREKTEIFVLANTCVMACAQLFTLILWPTFFTIRFFFFMEDNCFTILCWFLPLINLWYIHAMEYYSAIKKNSVKSVPVRWMNLEPIIQSELSQKEKDKYYILPGSKCCLDGPPQSNSSLWYF